MKKKEREDETKTQAFETKTLEELTRSDKSHPNNKFIRSDLIDTVNLKNFIITTLDFNHKYF